MSRMPKYAARADSTQRSIIEALHPNAIDLSGQRFGRLLVKAPVGRVKGSILWECLCDCGQTSQRTSAYLRLKPSDLDHSCGCARYVTAFKANCARCSKEFLARYRASRGSNERYCSTQCAANGRDFKAEKNPNWKNNATEINLGGRLTHRYTKWRKAILERDGRTCVECGSKERIEVDHLEPWALFEESRFELENGQCLCHECHKGKTLRQRMYRARKRDKSEKPIVDALRAAGWMVIRLDQPCDLLCIKDGIVRLLECKTPTGKRNPTAKWRRDQEEQNEFCRRTGTPRVTTAEEALAALACHGIEVREVRG